MYYLFLLNYISKYLDYLISISYKKVLEIWTTFFYTKIHIYACQLSNWKTNNYFNFEWKLNFWLRLDIKVCYIIAKINLLLIYLFNYQKLPKFKINIILKVVEQIIRLIWELYREVWKDIVVVIEIGVEVNLLQRNFKLVNQVQAKGLTSKMWIR